MRVGISPSSFGASDRGAFDQLALHGVDYELNPHGRRLTEAEARDFLADKDGLLAGVEPLTRAVLAAASPRLKAIARVGVGTSNVDLEAAAELGIKVSNTPDAPTEAVAEMTLAALLALFRQLVPMDRDVRAGTWKKRLGRSLAGATVLVVGYGRIGRRSAELFAMLRARVLVCDPAIRAADLRPGEELVELRQGLARAAAVVLHADASRPIIDAAALEAVPDGCVLLNAGRGELVDEAAVHAALVRGKLGAAWFDVFRDEPYAGPLTALEGTVLTPHCATYTVECRSAMELAATRNLLRDLGLAPSAAR